MKPNIIFGYRNIYYSVTVKITITLLKRRVHCYTEPDSTEMFVP